MPTHAYIRVSTQAQDDASQRETITAWATANSTRIDSWTIDHKSGGIPWQDRSLAAVLNTAAAGDVIVVSEISRIARSTVGVLSFLEAATAAQVGVRSLRPDLLFAGDLMGQVAATLFGLMAQIERHMIRERTRAALAARRAAGVQLGRPAGALGPSKLDGKDQEIANLLGAKVPKRAIARVLGVSPGVLYRFLNKRADPDPATGQLPFPPRTV